MTPGAEDALLSAAASISDGGRIDWRQLGHAADDPIVLEQLQIIGRIAQVHAARTSWGALSILEPIGTGTFGTVYRAFDNDLHREVALKVTRADALTVDPDRLVREARLLARVRHANVVTVYSAERKDDEIGVSMELIKGQTLDEIVKAQGAFGANETAVIGVDVCRAVAAVHAAGLLHGDIKAHNVMRGAGGRVVLMDFGASRDLARSPLGDDFAGTPLYVAPEVFAGEPRSRASDIYSVGVLLYYLATGTYPIEGDTRTAITRQHEQRAPRRHLRDVRPDLPPGFIDVVERATDVDPARRYSTAGALEAALAKSLGLSSGQRRFSISSIVIAAGIALIAVLVGAGAYWELRESRRPNALASVRPGTETVAPNAGPAAAASPYDVAATMYRVDAAGSARPLVPGDRLAPGDQLYLQVRTSVPANVYVVNEDDRGESYLLFPLPNQARGNPLPAGREHRLPGTVAGREMYWQVTSAGGHEHFVIFVSPQPLTAFEETFASLPRPTTREPVLSARLSERAIGVLRGVGGLVPAPNQPAQTSGTLSAQYSTPLPSGTETTQGPWVRQVTFENP